MTFFTLLFIYYVGVTWITMFFLLEPATMKEYSFSFFAKILFSPVTNLLMLGQFCAEKWFSTTERIYG